MKYSKDHPAVEKFMKKVYSNMFSLFRERDAVRNATDSEEKEHHQNCCEALENIYRRDMEVLGRLGDIEKYFKNRYRIWLYIAFCAIGVAVGVIAGVILH